MNANLTLAEPSRETFRLKETQALHSGLALLSIIAVLCLTLEVELLQQIDSLRLYLTPREISLESGSALLFLLAIASCWWLLVLLIGRLAVLVCRVRQFRTRLFWSLWIAAPLAYLSLDVFQDFKLELFPRWHAGTNVQMFSALALTGVGIVLLLALDWRSLQEFCRTRLVPIAGLHLALAVVAVPALWLHGVRLFRDYELPSHASAVSGRPDIFLVTIDTLRADDLSVYGFPRLTTPNLEKLAQRSFVFDYFFANSNFTTPTTSSIETGKLPWSHRVFQGGGFLRAKNQRETLAELLKHQGYYTAMMSSNSLAAPFHHKTLASYEAVEYASPRGFTGFRLRESNLLGLNTQCTIGFSLIRAVNSVGPLDHFILGDQYPSPAEDVFEGASKLIEQHKSSQPIFLWSHILPPHEPYWVPPSYRHRFVSEGVRAYANFTLSDTEILHRGVTLPELHDAYDEMILYADHSVGDFLDWLDKTGRLDRSIVIISADHGELFDHNRLSHGGPDLYNGVIHIPLLIHLPGQKKGVRIQELGQQADLLSTVLDVIGAPIPGWTDGESLKPSLEAKTLPDRYVFSMNLEPNSIFAPISKGTIAVMDGQFKFVRYLQSGKEQLYRYRSDPGEEHNLVESEPQLAQRMRDVLSNKLREVNQHFSGVP